MAENVFCSPHKGSTKAYRDNWDRIFGTPAKCKNCVGLDNINKVCVMDHCGKEDPAEETDDVNFIMVCILCNAGVPSAQWNDHQMDHMKDPKYKAFFLPIVPAETEI